MIHLQFVVQKRVLGKQGVKDDPTGERISLSCSMNTWHPPGSRATDSDQSDYFQHPLFSLAREGLLSQRPQERGLKSIIAVAQVHLRGRGVVASSFETQQKVPLEQCMMPCRRLVLARCSMCSGNANLQRTASFAQG